MSTTRLAHHLQLRTHPQKHTQSLSVLRAHLQLDALEQLLASIDK